jgi:copper chaperone CopZ
MKKESKQTTIHQTCNLCGLPLRHGTATAVISGKSYSFCCNGCRQVFTILMEATDSPNPETFRETDLFRQCRAKGIIPNSEEELSGAHSSPISETDATPADTSKTPAGVARDNILTLKLIVANMWCSACAWVIDESLKKTEGIVDSACNFLTDRLQVTYDPVNVTPGQIVAAISKLGYRAVEPGESREAAERRKELRGFLQTFLLKMRPKFPGPCSSWRPLF